MNNQQKPSFFKTGKGMLLLGFIVITIIGIPAAVYLVQQQQIFEQHAWMTSQKASAVCGPDGKVVITAEFTNTEPAGNQWAMNVVVSDAQTGGSVNIGRVDPGQTKSGAINTNATSINAGAVVYTLTWSDGRSGKDTRTASYPAVAACATPTATNTPTVSATNTPTTSPSSTPTNTPTVSLTSTPTGTPTDTPTGTTTPTGTPTDTPTGTTTPTTVVTSTPTETPPPGATETPTNTITSTPFPTIPPTGPNDLLISFGAISFMLVLIGGLVFILL